MEGLEPPKTNPKATSILRNDLAWLSNGLRVCNWLLRGDARAACCKGFCQDWHWKSEQALRSGEAHSSKDLPHKMLKRFRKLHRSYESFPASWSLVVDWAVRKYLGQATVIVLHPNPASLQSPDLSSPTKRESPNPSCTRAGSGFQNLEGSFRPWFDRFAPLPCLTGPNFIHPHPPTPENTLLGVGRIKGGGV